MRKHYDFSKMKQIKNPYPKLLKKSVHIRLDEDVIAYFKNLSHENDVPYQTLINMYLRDCAKKKKHLQWEDAG